MNRTKQSVPLALTAAATVLLFLGCSAPVVQEEVQGTIGKTLASEPAMDREPLVVYDVSGHGIAGPIHQHLAVYSSGLVSFSSFTVGGSSAAMTQVTSERVVELNEALMVAGALELPDRWSQVADLPMTTVTVFNGSEPNALHNTFSFYDVGPDPEGRPSGSFDYEAVVALLTGFLNEAFAGG